MYLVQNLSQGSIERGVFFSVGLKGAIRCSCPSFSYVGVSCLIGSDLLLPFTAFLLGWLGHTEKKCSRQHGRPRHGSCHDYVGPQWTELESALKAQGYLCIGKLGDLLENILEA